ncbi:aldo/keto reductase [Paraburkholderia acidisoli]|uniref:Aldo/keto reductase n=1 Tax=Paraburkholderia acidisoli TaxID=2571748 RepID=A0A7Z2JJG4_9BURK|nr:aldo/keto reductase [Paraburkholderia acidisoli]QGZ65345.1 aldo/keto reductase [Paraburkholderia acidisoli]
MTNHPAPTIKLHNGVEMPQTGLGTWPLDDTGAAQAVASALQTGYRLVDTAENYGNETGVGEGIRQSGVARDAIFVTSKFNRAWHSVEGAQAACEASLKRLGLDYLDLLLIHWPNPDQDRYVEAFEGLVRLLEAGKVRAIGTSNFKPDHLQRLFDAGFVPHVNQIQLDPYHAREDLVAIHMERGIVTETWSPIGRGGELLAEPLVVSIAQRYGRTPAQIVLRWQVQRGFVPVPKSADPERQALNLDIFDFQLTDEEMTAVATLKRDDPQMLDADVFGH